MPRKPPRPTPGRPTPQAQAVFTIVSANYIALAATLMQSVRDHHPGAARFIVLVDALQDFPGLDLAAELLPADACGIAGFANMALWYDVMELNTAVKPSVFLHLFGRGFGQVAYLDPDILVTAPLQPVWDGLDGHSCVLTPHHLQPLQDGHHPDDLAILKSGVYNLGFLGLRNDGDAARLARWWAGRLLTGCRVDLPGHMFTDQRWMDLAPAFVPRTLILRHPGCNLAYWNLPHREVRGSAASGYTVDGQDLVFAHFSGIRPDDPDSFSKHQDRYDAGTLPPAVADLCAAYRRRVMGNGWTRSSTLPYAYGCFPDGRRIEPAMRRWLLRALDSGRLDQQEPVRIPSDFFDHPEDGTALGAPITRLMHQLWLDRPDLQAHSPVATPAGAAAYRGWFLSGEAAASDVDPRSIAAARRLGLPHSFPTQQPPWPPVAGTVWSGPAAAAAGFLAADVLSELDGAPLPEGMALHVDRNLVHLNAETALEDWAWMRKLGVHAARTVGWWAWELETLPARWMASYSYYDEVWGISAFTTAALARPGLRPARTVPQPVHLPDGFAPAPRAHLGLAEGETVFLFMFDPHSFVERKNPQGVVRAFAQAFPAGDEPVRLVIKTHHGADFPEVMAMLRALSDDPRVEVRDEYASREDVLGLVAAADAFVSLHRSEGFGRGPAEAMLLGKPVILTDYSGTQDFADAGVALLVPCRLVPVAPDEYIGVEGQRWADPDVAAAAAHMRWVTRNPAAARGLGLRARARILAAHGPATVGRQVLEALGLDAPIGAAARFAKGPRAKAPDGTRSKPEQQTRRKTA